MGSEQRCNCAIVFVSLCNEPLLSASQTYFHFSATSAAASVQVLDLGLCLLYSYLPVSRRASAVVVAFGEWPWSQDSQSHFSGKPCGWGRLAAPGRVGCSGWHHHTIPRPSLWTCPGSYLSSPPGPQPPPVCSRALYIHIYIHADTHTVIHSSLSLSLSLILCLTAIQSPTDIILLCSTGLFHFCSLVFSQEYKPFSPLYCWGADDIRPPCCWLRRGKPSASRNPGGMSICHLPGGPQSHGREEEFFSRIMAGLLQQHIYWHWNNTEKISMLLVQGWHTNSWNIPYLYASNLDVHWQMNEEVVVQIYNGILLSHKKECIWVTSNEVDEPRAHYTEWSKSER